MPDPRTYAGTHTGSNPSPDGFCDEPDCGCNADTEPVLPRTVLALRYQVLDRFQRANGGPDLNGFTRPLASLIGASAMSMITAGPDGAPPIVCPGCEAPEATPPMHNLEPGVCNVAIEIDRVIASAGSYCDGCGCHLGDEPHEEECDRGIDLAALRRIIGESVEDAPPIVITIRGGIVESIDNVPPGAVLEVRDYDTEQLDPAALVTDGEGRSHSLAIHHGSGVGPPTASAADAFTAARLLVAAYTAGEESGGSMEWADIDDAHAAARRFVDASEGAS